MYHAAESHDVLIWDKHDQEVENDIQQMQQTHTLLQVQKLASQRLGKDASLVLPLIAGGFNMVYRLRIEGSCHDAIVRLPFPTAVAFAADKVLYEAATATLLAQETSLPVQRVFSYGQRSQVGPYVML